MKFIKIINGIYGHRRGGKGHPEPKDTTSPAFLVEDAEAARLVALHVAAYLDEVVPEEPVAAEGFEEDFTTDGIKKKTNTELRALAAEIGADVSRCKTKAELIEVILSNETDEDDDIDLEDDVDDDLDDLETDEDDDLVDLEAAEPVLE